MCVYMCKYIYIYGSIIRTHVFPLSAYIEMRSQLDACKVCYYIYLSIYLSMYVCVYMCEYIYMAI